MVEAERNRKNLIVVTSDTTLAARVRANGVRVMRSGEFRQMLDKTLDEAVDAAPDEEPNIKDDEIDKWLRYFGIEESGN